LFITVHFRKDFGNICFKKLIMKLLFQNKTFFLQSSKVVIFWETGKKSCFSEKICSKTFISKHFVLIFAFSKQLFLR